MPPQYSRIFQRGIVLKLFRNQTNLFETFSLLNAPG
jgi:hypothetical protein